MTEKLKDAEYPVAFGRKMGQGKPNRPVVVVFFVGGATYDEAKEADEYDPAKVIIGGTFIHNSKTFIGEIIQLQGVSD
jgi:vacuolar protein sorting-associated protein 45